MHGGVVRRLVLLSLLLACTDPPARKFVLPASIEDARARFLVAIPEGREIAAARAWMEDHSFACGLPAPSGRGFASECRARDPAADAGFGNWEVTLYDRNGRLADVQVRTGR